MIIYNLLWAFMEVFIPDYLIIWFYPLICIYLIGCIPGLFRLLFTWR